LPLFQILLELIFLSPLQAIVDGLNLFV